MNDWQLLVDYVERNDEVAFSTLVRQHLDFVFSIAMRRAGRSDLAEETTQAVFLLLSRKAGTFNKRVILPSWLYRATCLIAAASLRAERTREQKEKEAGMMMSQEPEEPLWVKLAPELDQAILQLSEKDRQAILLRFFQKQSVRDSAAAMQLNEEAAKKRITRAIEKLRGILNRNRVALSVTSLGTLLAERSVSAAPAGLEQRVKRAIIKTPITAGLNTLLIQAGKGLFWHRIREMALSMTVTLGSSAIVFCVGLLILQDRSKKTIGGPSLNSQVNVAGFPGEKAQPTNVYREFILTTVDEESGAPLNGVQFHAKLDGPKIYRVDAVSDAQGECLFRFPWRAFDGLTVWAFESHHIGKRIDWKASEGTSYPDTYQLKLHRGEHLDGTVMDADGNPVPDARVALSYFEGDVAHRETIGTYWKMSYVTTDEKGKWQLDFLPAKPKLTRLVVTHPDFARLRKSFEDEKISPGIELYLEPGVSFSGKIIGDGGQPVVDGIVEADVGAEVPMSVPIEADGSFHFLHLPMGNGTFTVTAPGYFEVEKKSRVPGQLEIQLTPRKHIGNRKLRGRVLDEDGSPVAGASVGKDGWSIQTADDGHFSSDDAADQPGEYTIAAANFEILSGVKLASDGLDHQIVLKRQSYAHLRGNVIDTTTKKPVMAFRVLAGSLQFDLKSLFNEPSFFGEGKNGIFDLINIRPQGLNEFLQIEAEGYEPFRIIAPGARAPWETGGFKSGQWLTNQEFNVELKPAEPITGTVMLPGLMPARNADVVLNGPGLPFDMQKPGRLDPGGRTFTRYVKTEANGRFSFPQTVGAERIIVAHEEGFATLPISELATNIVLRPWGEVEGMLVSQGVPRAQQEITIFSEDWTTSAMHGSVPFSFIYDTRTDSEGRFHFSKVPAVSTWVARRYLSPRKHGSMGFTQTQRIQVLPGKSTDVILGKSGSSLSGKFVLKCNDPKWICRLSLHRVEPVNLHNIDRSPEISEFWAEPDGSFLIDDIKPGNYRLRPRIITIPSGDDPKKLEDEYIGKDVVSACREFTVSKPEPGQSFPKIDLGEITIEPELSAQP